MRRKGNQNQDEEEYEDEDFGPREDAGPSSNVSTTTTINHHNSNSISKGIHLLLVLVSKRSLIFSRSDVMMQVCVAQFCKVWGFLLFWGLKMVLFKWGHSILMGFLGGGPDGKNDDKVDAIRSKHSVTEQRRRIKINERFQILRELIPHGDQKRDTASFLLEVIEYVQYLQEKVQKYEVSYEGWGSEPAKLMPWRNSHWRAQSFVAQPQPVKNGSGTGSTFAGRFDENKLAISPTILTNLDNPVESDPNKEVTCKAMEQQPEFANKATTLPMSLQTDIPASVRGIDASAQALQQTVSDLQSDECPMTNDPLKQQDKLTVEGGTISVSSVYSDGCVRSFQICVSRKVNDST
uniref:BHLH domain-containing protein n=1 Tax=Rhizophora mucronata TaxID=61149 RepID=A0A2P2LNA4_RHIMU